MDGRWFGFVPVKILVFFWILIFHTWRLIAHRLMTTPLRREEAETYFSSSSEEQQESVSSS